MNTVSIIIANYNNAKYLPECFDSILKQTYKDIELVVVDDCSTDHSREIIQSYAAKHPGIFTPILLQKNAGVAYARHAAIMKAKGNYITTLDADDHYADATKLDKEMKLILDYKKEYNEDIIAFSNIIQKFNDSSTRLVGNDKNIVQGNILEPVMARSCMIPRDFILLRSAYFEVGGYDTSLPIYEDWDLKIRIASKYRFFYTGINGIVYVRHGQGLSNASLDYHIKIVNRIFKKNQALIDKSRLDETRSQFDAFVSHLKSRFFNKNIPLLQDFYNKRQYISFISLWKRFADLEPALYNPKKSFNLFNNGNKK
jgi:glycosyltransferase involved in cell wall biosynthesis